MKLNKGCVLIQEKKVNKSASGVFLPDDNFISEKAEVLDVAKDVTFCKKGDTVLYKSYNPDRFEEDGEEFAIIEEKHIRAVL